MLNVYFILLLDANDISNPGINPLCMIKHYIKVQRQPGRKWW